MIIADTEASVQDALEIVLLKLNEEMFHAVKL